MSASVLAVRSIADHTPETSRFDIIQITGIDLRAGGKIIVYFRKLHERFPDRLNKQYSTY
jgi:hypothetical protein